MDDPQEQPAPPLSDKQQKAVLALLSSGSLKEAARAARVGYSTLRGWLKTEAVRDAATEARREALTAALVMTQGGAVEAVNVLRNALGSKDAATRIRAADNYLRHLGALTEYLDVAELGDRIAELEAAAKGTNPTWPRGQ